jgi:hypothetical protein
MTMFRRTLLAAVSAAALLGSVQTHAQDIQNRLIRFGYGLNEQSNQGRAVKVFAEEVEKPPVARCVSALSAQPLWDRTPRCNKPSSGAPRK